MWFCQADQPSKPWIEVGTILYLHILCSFATVNELFLLLLERINKLHIYSPFKRSKYYARRTMCSCITSDRKNGDPVGLHAMSRYDSWLERAVPSSTPFDRNPTFRTKDTAGKCR